MATTTHTKPRWDIITDCSYVVVVTSITFLISLFDTRRLCQVLTETDNFSVDFSVAKNRPKPTIFRSVFQLPKIDRNRPFFGLLFGC